MSNENQHWVPKFLIKNFTDADGRVFCLDTLADEVTKLPPRKAASEIGFNDFYIDGEAASFEDQLEKIETKAAPVLKRIVTTRTLSGLEIKDRQRVAEFISAQSFRTKAFYEGFTNKRSRREFGRIFKQLWECAFVTASEISRRHWVLMEIETNSVFYLGDNPVVLQRTDNPKDGTSLGFDVKGVEAFLPLSPKCALYMPCKGTSTDRIVRYEAALELHRAVRSTVLRGLPGGSTELKTAQTVIARLHHLYQALTTGAPLKANPENIENLNYLQCSWSHAAIYSNRCDFAFARRVFRESPQYKGVPKTSLIQMRVLIPESAAKPREPT